MAIAHPTPGGGGSEPAAWLDTVASIGLIMVVGGWETVIRGVVVLGILVVVVVAVVSVTARPCGTIV